MSTTPPTGPAGTPDPDDRGDPGGQGVPPGGPVPGTPDSSSRRVTRWLSSSYRWQGLLAALVAAVAGIVVAFISRDPQQQTEPRPPAPTDVRSRPVVVTQSTWQDADPASPPSGITVTFEGTFSGLARDSRLFAMVLRGKDRADWPVALAELDWPHGTWRAVVRVAEPKLPLEYTTGVIPGVPKARPPALVSGAPESSHPPDDDVLERLRRDGPRAEGITGSPPFRPVAPGSGTASAPASPSPQRRTG
ncbi:hypothetical protein [Streptomyces sp. MJM1172]|uniref:hypothetical protein n=1 Tax=Streptomyces sp. MJM1172 TaxID=1703926 RepID=UPI00093E59CC|nr:hypothetical protein [Streptomyces sp. MJM1172]OKI62049.1 hypothetical protein AMK15_17765 [Streptomyces sp. MJM1172]